MTRPGENDHNRSPPLSLRPDACYPSAMPTPKIARAQVLVRIPPELREALHARSLADERPMRWHIERAIRAYLALPPVASTE